MQGSGRYEAVEKLGSLRVAIRGTRTVLKRNFSTASTLPVQYLSSHLNTLGSSLKLETCGLNVPRLSAIGRFLIHQTTICSCDFMDRS